jgi:hypothetical protein
VAGTRDLLEPGFPCTALRPKFGALTLFTVWPPTDEFATLTLGEVMASWDLTCANCRKLFTHCEAGERTVDLHFAEQPKFPTEGLECECPYCHVISLYHKFDLIYCSSSLAYK